jgi:hypothetical protein
VAAAEVVLSENARRVFAKSRGKTRRALEAALRRLEDDASWDGQLRFIAPARSRWHGYICDVSARPYLIVYRVVDGGAAIEVPVIQPVEF